MKDTIISKIIDIIFDLVIKFFVYVLRILSPIKITPKEILSSSVGGFVEILDIRIENRLNTALYDIFIAGISKKDFDVKIISDDGPKGKTVEHTDINTNHLVVYATNIRNGDNFWIFRIHKFKPKEVLNLKVKIRNSKPIYFKVLKSLQKENPIKEDDGGVVQIPFLIEKIPEI
jgi:hypothetical protein